MTGRGGRIPPDGRQPAAKGVGKRARRHDLERPATPGLHGSDLQQGDVQAMEQGQRIAPASTQQPGQAAPRPASGGGGMPQQGGGGGMEIPDAIDFLAGRNGDEFNEPQVRRQIDESKAQTWLPVLRLLANGPGASSALVNALINQARVMQQSGGQPATFVDLHAADDGIEEMLDVGIMPTGGMEEAPPEEPGEVLSEEPAAEAQPEVE